MNSDIDGLNRLQLTREYFSSEHTFDLINIEQAQLWNLFASSPQHLKAPIMAFPGAAADFFNEFCERHPSLADLVVAYGAATLSGATQAHCDVKLPWMEAPRPLGLYFFVGGPVFCGKSFAAAMVGGTVFEGFSKERCEKYEEDVMTRDRRVREWKREYKRLEKIHAAATTTEELLEAANKLNQHGDPPSKTPRLRPFLCNDLSQRALAEMFRGDGEWGALCTEEGANVADGSLFDDLPTLNDIFEGDSIPKRLGYEKHFIANNRRFMIRLSAQDDCLIDILMKRIKRMTDVGFISRLLMLIHKSAVPIEPSTRPWIHQAAYYERLWELLRTAPLCSTGSRSVLMFDSQAADLLCQIQRSVQTAIQPGGNLAVLRPYLARTPDMIARQAASFHVVDRRRDLIPVDTVRRAASVISFLARESARVGHVELPAAQFGQEKALVERHVLNRLANCDSGEIEWDKLYGSTTTALRNRPERYGQIMNALQTDGKINIYRRDYKRMVSIRQNFTAWRSNC